MKKFLLALLLFVTAITLTGCSDKNSPVGRWQRVGGSPLYYFASADRVEFFKNGTVMEYEYSEGGSWSISGEYIIIVGSGNSGTESFKYMINGDTMILTDRDGDSATYQRVD